MSATLALPEPPHAGFTSAAPAAPVPGALRPSEYTAALIQVLHARAEWARGASALDLGSGSGVVLAVLGALGAASLCGIDIDAEAVVAGKLLLHSLGHGARTEMHGGDLWEPASGRQFDLIAANLPQFPMAPNGFAGRRSSWSCGGPSGRCLLDRFFDRLGDHLTPGGRAIITHNGFVDLDLSQRLAARAGLSLRVAATHLVHIHTEKLALMTPGILGAEEGRSIHRYGPHVFGEMHVVEIGTAAALA